MTRLSRKIRAGFSVLAIVGLVLPVPSAFAGGDDFDLDFAAVAPQGDGYWNDGTIGQDIVKSLATPPYTLHCGEIVTFLTQIRLDPSAPGPEDIEVLHQFTRGTTGQQGVCLGSLVRAQINHGDPGIVGDGGSTVTVLDTSSSGPMFTKGAILSVKVRVSDLDPGATTVLREDIRIYCDPGTRPTGILQARLGGAAVVNPPAEVGIINTGDQTIPVVVNLLSTPS
jgi:hypothetical protein